MPVVVQDDETGEILMLAYMNRGAWLKTLETGKATYWSRSRQSLWLKGETSGHVQLVREVLTGLRRGYHSAEGQADWEAPPVTPVTGHVFTENGSKGTSLPSENGSLIRRMCINE